MSWRNERRPRVEEPKESYFPVRGGLDLVTPPYSINPGKMIDCFRYEIAPSGGAKPVDGFERVDGQGLPSEAVFQYLEYDSDVTEVTVGTHVTGSTSAATGISLMTGSYDFEQDGEMVTMAGKGVFLLTSGQFVDGEDILDVATPVATISSAYTPNTEIVDSHELHFHWLAVEQQRSMINIVPGSGPVRGVWRYNGSLYAFRDNVAATECIMYKEDSASGWAAVSGVSTLLPGGTYEFVNTNFGGSTSTIMMYGVDGINKGFQFDGTTFVQITTGMTVDAPFKLWEHHKHLFFAFPKGSLQHSPPTDPTGTWSVVVDAGELGMGEEITNLLDLPGGALGIWCKDSIHILYGSSANTSSADLWNLKSHSKTSGAIAGTVQAAGKILFLNNTGIADFQATNVYGSFKSGSISTEIQPLLDRKKTNAIGSVVVTNKNQYRLFFSDGYCITVDLSGKYPQFTQSHYDKVVRCISAPKRATDEPGAIYFGSDDGYVYKMDSGVSLDENPMMAYARLPYSHQGAPRYKKRYRELVAEIDQFSGSNLTLSFLPDFSFSQSDIPQHNTVDISESTSGAGLWDITDWNDFSWSGNSSGGGGGGTASGDIDGIATEIGLMLYFNATNTVTPPHIINGIFIYYNLLGRQS